MSAEYSVKEVLNMAMNVRDCAWPADVKEYMVLIEPMLTAYAERIKADERGEFAECPICKGWSRHPPAQAAQVSDAASLTVLEVVEQLVNERDEALAKLAADPVAHPDPLGCNDCTHPNCGRYDGPRSVECRAMLNNACARPAGHHPHSPDAADSGRVDDVSFSTVEKVVKALCRIGHTFPESQEEQAARFESLVLDLCRSVQSHFDGLTALAAQGQGDRDAYEGARHDLLDWKHRALSAESILRSLGYRGIVPTEPPASPAGVPDRALLRAVVDEAWGEATESEQVPSTIWADRIIDRVLAAAPSATPEGGEVGL